MDDEISAMTWESCFRVRVQRFLDATGDPTRGAQPCSFSYPFEWGRFEWLGSSDLYGNSLNYFEN